jgi:hypothetical protein
MAAQSHPDRLDHILGYVVVLEVVELYLHHLLLLHKYQVLFSITG